MRVAVVASPQVAVPPKLYGGTELVIHFLIKGLTELGHEPILLASGDSVADCEIIPIVDKAIGFPKNPKDLPEYQRVLNTINKRTEKLLKGLLPTIDIIHSHGFDLKKFQDFPNVTTLHSGFDFDKMIYYFKRVDLPYVSISRNQQEAFPVLNYVSTVYNGEDPDDYPIVHKPQDYLCFLGRFDRDKNPHLAIELALNLKIKIKIAGKIDHQGRDYFNTEIKKYLDHPLVEYLGEIGLEDKIKLLSNAKCNLHPTGFREPFGLTVLEAAYCGTPTMAVTRGSMPELIEEGKTGVLVEDFVEGYHHMQECFKMDREYIAKRARKLFNYHQMAEGYVGAYNKVLRYHAKGEKSLTSRVSGNERNLALATGLVVLPGSVLALAYYLHKRRGR